MKNLNEITLMKWISKKLITIIMICYLSCQICVAQNVAVQLIYNPNNNNVSILDTSGSIFTFDSILSSPSPILPNSILVGGFNYLASAPETGNLGEVTTKVTSQRSATYFIFGKIKVINSTGKKKGPFLGIADGYKTFPPGNSSYKGYVVTSLPLSPLLYADFKKGFPSNRLTQTFPETYDELKNNFNSKIAIYRDSPYLSRATDQKTCGGGTQIPPLRSIQDGPEIGYFYNGGQLIPFRIEECTNKTINCFDQTKYYSFDIVYDNYYNTIFATNISVLN